MNTNPVRVVFRMWRNESGVVALFPHESATVDRPDCLSYEHIGQHGAADYSGVIALTRPATPAEYAPLKRELEQIGYALTVTKRK